MQELIWFSMPGAMIILAVIGIFPSTINSEGSAPILVISVPIIGFIAHQFYRLVFESFGGFALKSRAVLNHISKNLTKQLKMPEITLQRSFLVWEITFYSKNFPSAFRDHDRGAWHYILSFWSISISASLSFVICLLVYFLMFQSSILVYVVLAELCAAIIFYLKGKSTYDSLVQQEIAVTYLYEELFIETLKALKKMK